MSIPPADRPVEPADAARLLRVVLKALPPETPREVAVARRVQGAAVALDLVANGIATSRAPDEADH